VPFFEPAQPPRIPVVHGTHGALAGGGAVFTAATAVGPTIGEKRRRRTLFVLLG
jgi:hypothetical protein